MCRLRSQVAKTRNQLQIVMPDDTLKVVITRHAARLLSLPDVVGIAEGETIGAPCIRVFVARKTEELLGSIPKNLDGWPVVVEETGGFRALNRA